MFSKVFIFACFVVLLCDAEKGHYIRDIVEEVCRGDDLQTCKESMKKCIPPFNEENRVEFHEKHCKIFGTCLDKVIGSRSVHDTFIKERHHGRDWCTNPREINVSEKEEETRPKPHAHMVKRRKFSKEKFEDFLNKTSSTATASEFKCCVAKENGMFNEDGTVNVIFWKEEATKFVDPVIKTSFEAGIDTCTATNNPCDMHGFKICVISECYNAIKSISPSQSNV